MKITKFLNIDIEPAPPELELEIEMQCREIMKSNDLDNIKRYCTHMVRKKFDQDIFIAPRPGAIPTCEHRRRRTEMIRPDDSSRRATAMRFFMKPYPKSNKFECALAPICDRRRTRPDQTTKFIPYR